MARGNKQATAANLAAKEEAPQAGQPLSYGIGSQENKQRVRDAGKALGQRWWDLKPSERKAIVGFISTLQGYQKKAAGSRERLKDAFEALPQDLKTLFSADKRTVDSLIRGAEHKVGYLKDGTATVSFTTPDRGKWTWIFGGKIYMGEDLESYKAAINTATVKHFLDGIGEADPKDKKGNSLELENEYVVRDDENEYIVLGAKWKKGVDSKEWMATKYIERNKKYRDFDPSP